MKGASLLDVRGDTCAPCLNPPMRLGGQKGRCRMMLAEHSVSIMKIYTWFRQGCPRVTHPTVSVSYNITTDIVMRLALAYLNGCVTV